MELVELFTHDYCKHEWMASMESCGFNLALKPDERMSLLWTELKRIILSPIAHGLVSINPHRATLAALKPSMGAFEAQRSSMDIRLKMEFDFSVENLPDYFVDVTGLWRAESWGRWSNGDTVKFVLRHWLKGCFRLYLNVVGYGPNLGEAVSVKVGRETKTFRLGTNPRDVRRVCLDFVLDDSFKYHRIQGASSDHPSK